MSRQGRLMRQSYAPAGSPVPSSFHFLPRDPNYRHPPPPSPPPFRVCQQAQAVFYSSGGVAFRFQRDGSSKEALRKERFLFACFSLTSAPAKIAATLPTMSATPRFKLSHKIQTQASFFSSSFHWLPISWRHHVGRCRGALLLDARSLSRAAQWKRPCGASPRQRARLFPEALAEVGGARPQLQVGGSHLGSSGHLQTRGHKARSQGSGCEWDGSGQGLACAVCLRERWSLLAVG